MKVISPARPVFLAVVFLALTAIGAVRAQETGKEPVAASPKPTTQGAKPATPAAATGAKASPASAPSQPPISREHERHPTTQSPAPPPTPNTQHPTPAASPTTIVTTPKGDTINVTVAAPAAPAEPKSNNWAAGIIGVALLAGLIFLGMRYARQRGMTMPDALQKMGVEMPQDGVAQGVRPLKPVAPPQPPLPSLADLPAVGAASNGAAAVAAPISAAPAYHGPPRLVGVEGAVVGVTLDLTEAFSIGRDAENALALTQDVTVSRRHASLEPVGGGWSVRDNESSNGTYVNGVRIAGAQPLHSGDEIQIGASRLRFEG